MEELNVVWRKIPVVGYDNNYGNVLEGRLKIEKVVRYGIEGYEMEEFMHGIYHSIDENVQLVYLADAAQYRERIVRLKNFMSDFTPYSYCFGNLDDKESADSRNLSSVFYDDADFQVFEYIIPLQYIAFYLSKDIGINANITKIINFHYLMGSK